MNEVVKKKRLSGVGIGNGLMRNANELNICKKRHNHR